MIGTTTEQSGIMKHLMNSSSTLSPLAKSLIAAFDAIKDFHQEGKGLVNPLISKFATWYEKLRTAMDYREEEVILRAAIERIVKRRIILGGSGKTIAEPLLRELVWARYVSDEQLSEDHVQSVVTIIDIYLSLRTHLLGKKVLSESTVNEWTYQLLSAALEQHLASHKQKELMANFMFHVMQQTVRIDEAEEQTRDAQVFIAVRRAFAKDDIAFLRYHLFTQIFGTLTEASLPKVQEGFKDAYEEIEEQLSYPYKERIYGYVKRKTAAFFILEDLLRVASGGFSQLAENEEELKKAVTAACELRYNSIAAKVRRAVVRSVIFLLLTKAFFGFAIEGTFESMIYGEIQWGSLLVNIILPPLLMVIISLFIRTPRKDNTERIFTYIRQLLFTPDPKLGLPLSIQPQKENKNTTMNLVFSFLWFMAFVVGFGVTVFVLTALHFNPISQGIFLFFVAVVSFLSYRIGTTSKEYAVEDKQGLLTPLVDFLFMPFVKVGRHLTEGISQVNVLLFIFDFIIETPFKGMFAFFEQWFFFLHAKREGLE